LKETLFYKQAELLLQILPFVKNILTKEEKQFLIAFKSLEPQWHLLGLDDIGKLPAVKWKLLNLEKMSKTKHQQALEKLINCLSG